MPIGDTSQDFTYAADSSWKSHPGEWWVGTGKFGVLIPPGLTDDQRATLLDTVKREVKEGAQIVLDNIMRRIWDET